MQYAFNQNANGNNNNNNNNAQQFIQQQQQSQQQQPQPQINNPNNTQLHNQMNQMQRQFNQFQINSNNNQQQQQVQTQNAQQNQSQNQHFQNQTSPQQNQQFSPLHAAQNQQQHQQQQNNAQNGQIFNFIPQQMQQPQQVQMTNGNSLFGQLEQPNVVQQQQQQGQEQIDPEASSLNPEIAEFNPFSGGTSENAAAVQLTVQEQLFSQLLQIQSNLTNIKQQTETVLAPTLLQLQNALSMFQSNPALMQANYVQFMQTQQQYTTIAYQIQQNQLNYAQLEQSLKYTQELYQKNKDEQYVVPMDDEEENMEQTEGDMTINQTSETAMDQNKYNLTSAVTDVGGGIVVTSHNQNNEQQQQQDTNGHYDKEEEQEQETHHSTQDIRQEANIISFDEHFERYKSPPKKEENNERFLRTDDAYFEQKISLHASKSYPSTQRDFDSQNFSKSPMMSTSHQSSISESTFNEEMEYQNEENEDEDDGYDEFVGNNTSKHPQKTNEINPGETCYAVLDLIKYQSQFLSINWREDAFKSIPRCVRFVGKGINNERYMTDVVAMFLRKASNPWLAGQAPTDKKTQCLKRMTGVLNKMTPEKFEKISKQTLDGINDFAETKEDMNTIIGLILEFGIKQPVFGGQYALLCQKVFDYLPRLTMKCDYEWLIETNDISNKFRKMVIQQTADLFDKHKQYDTPLPSEKDLKYKEDIEMAQSKRKQNFFAVMELVAEIYNVSLVHRNLIFRGVVDPLLPPKNTNLSAVDVEGICRLLKRCGKRLDVQSRDKVNRCLQKLSVHSKKFDFRTRVLVDEIKEMRGRGWEHRLKKEVAKTLKELHEDIAEEEEAAKAAKSSYYHGNSRKTNNKRRKERDYNDYEYEIGDYEDKKYKNGQNDYRRKSNKGGNDRYKRKHNDEYEERNGDRARYKPKRKVGGGLIATKSIGSSYQKKSSKSPKKVGFLSRSQSVQVVVPESKQFKKLKGFIDEYMVSCDMTDIEEYLDTKHVNVEVWAKVINDGLQNRKPKEMEWFIEFIVTMFDKEYLHNKNAQFINIVVKLLVIELDDVSLDVPNYKQYVSKLFAHLCYNEHVKVNAVYQYFIKTYQQKSVYQSKKQKDVINKMIEMSVDELNYLKCSNSIIKKVRQFCL